MSAPNTLLDLISARYGTNKAVIIPDGPTLTYSQLRQLTEQISYALADFLPSFSPNTSIAISLLNGLEFTACFFAITWLRGISAPLNPTYTKEENKFYLSDTKCAAIIVHKGEAEVARQAAKEENIPMLEIYYDKNKKTLILTHENRPLSSNKSISLSPQPSDICLILHTSGTTSRPKAVPLTHRNICTSVKNISQTYELTAKDRSLVVMPLFHVHGLIGVLLSTLATGGLVVIPPRFSAKVFWSLFDEYQCSWYSAVPTIHQILVKTEYENYKGKEPPTPVKKRPYHRFIRSCSSALAPATFKQLESLYGVPVIEAYAMTEAAHQMTSNNLPHRGPRKAGSVGCGQGVQVAILDDSDQILGRHKVGEVCIKGENVTPGYLNNPGANKLCFTSNGWFRTGDQGYLDDDDYVHLTGRLKELISRGGEKFAPQEIDHVLLLHPAVNEAITFGVEDTHYGQIVNAAVVLKNKISKEEEPKMEQQLKQWCSSKLVAFKVPVKIYITDAVPRTATGKIQRRHVAAAFAQKKSKL